MAQTTPSRSMAGLLSCAAIALLLPFSGCLGLPASLSNGSDDHGTGGDGNLPDVAFGAVALSDQKRLVGARLDDWPSASNDLMTAYETKTGARLDVVDFVMDWSTPFRNASHAVDVIAERGSIPMITWEANGLSTPQIANGSTQLKLRDGRSLTVDAYLSEFAVGVCGAANAYDVPVLVRPLREPNADWFTWALHYTDDSGSKPNTEASYRAAWEKIRSGFGSYCEVGTDVMFVWSVHHNAAADKLVAGYPGDASVEFVGLDGYNWGDEAPWGWQSFQNLFRHAYCTLTTESGKPVLITEWASTSAGGDKAAWIAAAFQRLAQGDYGKVAGLIWVQSGQSGQPDMDWSFDSTAASAKAYAEGVAAIQAQRAAGAGGVAAEAGSPCG